MKKLIKTIAIALVFPALFGCSLTGFNNKSNDIKAVDSQLKLVKKQQKTKYLSSNPITINQVLVKMNIKGLDFAVYMPQIYDLTDTALEDKINKTILEDLKTEIINRQSEITARKDIAGIYCETRLNANNLLCISLGFNDIRPYSGFLYRLIDGKRLSLKDIFTEGTDYIALLNPKVVEGILKSGKNEVDILKAPFTTIKPNQDFAISDQELNIIFHTGESSFIEPVSISIPLSTIDDYVSILDSNPNIDTKFYKNVSRSVKTNNIFTDYKTDSIQKNNGMVIVRYPIISGLGNKAFEDKINKAINKTVYEVAEGDYFKNLKPPKEGQPIAEVGIYVNFNNSGFLCLSRQVIDITMADNLGFRKFTSTLSYDLINMKETSVKELLNSYFDKHLESRDKFVSQAKDFIGRSFSDKEVSLKEEVLKAINYNFLMNKASINVNQYEYDENALIIFTIDSSAIKGLKNNIYGIVPLKECIPVPFEELLKL